MITGRPAVRHAAVVLTIIATCLPTVAEEDNTPVSFHDQVLPLLRANCQGCHQPAKQQGAYLMTDFARLLKGGESEEAAIVPGKPEDSYLMLQITAAGEDRPAMPPSGKPLTTAEVDLIRRWIAEGAKDDSPPAARPFSESNPPVYSLPPVVASLDYSPDGRLIAVAGFNEVLLHRADGSGIAKRLIGLSQRIESVRFSPDGTRLAVTGGQPGVMGEVQIWDIASGELELSHSVTFDTVYGASWSPDGTQVAFGCADNTLRAIDAQSGEQVLFQGAHSDWVRDTVYTVENESPHVVSVSRDMTVKLTEVSTNRFIDNVTSITPKALKGGVNSIARHPERDEIIVGGADGVPKIYRVFRITARKIGDDSNLIKRLQPMAGRVFGVAVSRDGQRIGAVSSLDGRGELVVYSYEFDTSLPADLKKNSAQRVRDRKPDDQKKLDAYRSKDIKETARLTIDESPLYAIAFHPGGRQVAVAGGDGTIRVINTENGQPIATFAAAPVDRSRANRNAADLADLKWSDSPLTTDEELPSGEIVSLQVEPSAIELSSPFEYAQLLVTATMKSGEQRDITRSATLTLEGGTADLTASGFVKPRADGPSTIIIEAAGQKREVPVSVTGVQQDFEADFVRHVNPVLTRVGCNQGTCHGARQGKNGFKLSLRGYDPIYDIRAFTDDMAGRRTNVASAENSLMLAKATTTVPHEGGQVLEPGSNYYEIVRNWISNGARLNLEGPRVASIAITPQNPVIQRENSRQQIRVVATYTDGTTRDVTREAFIDSGNTEVALTNRWGLMTAIRRGEAPILARFEGSYAATTLTVMGNREGFVWEQPETWGKVDELVASKWQRMKIQPSELCSETEFLRRVHLDLTGLPPTAADVRAFLADERDVQTRRAAVVDTLIGNPDFVEHWTNKWADLLQVNRKFLGPEGAKSFRDWIRTEVNANTPYDEFVRKVITANGSNKENPAASYYKILREPVDIMENTTHLFLGVRFNCNKCHDHPFERWTQDQYYETAAYFARVGLKADPASGKRRIGGTAVEGAKPFYEVVFEKPDGEVKHDRTGAMTPPTFPFQADFDVPEKANRRDELAAWITSADNEYFARSYVNRLWGYMLGVGIREPIDDLRAGNPATNPELLDYLAEEFIRSNFDARHVLQLICKSRTYQLSLATNRWNEDDGQNYSHAIARRLPAEVLYDAIHRVLGAKTKIPGVPEGTRASAIPDAGVKLPDGFLANLGRPVRESACECERSADLQLGPIMALIGGPTVGTALDAKDNELVRLVKEMPDDRQLIDEVFVRIFNRPATEAEIEAAVGSMQQIAADHTSLTQQLGDRESWWQQEQPKREAARVASIASAKQELTTYEQSIAAERERQEAERVRKLATVQADFDAYNAAAPANAAAYAAKNKGTEWFPLAAEAVQGPKGVTLESLEDRSIRATGTADKGAYTITVKTSLQNIQAFRIEALQDDTREGSGPGLPNNGNFVVTEFDVQAASMKEPTKFAKVNLQNAKADFLQAGFNIGLTIDGNAGNQNAWAVANAGGVTHWATFETKQPVHGEGGTILKFVIHQNHNAKQHLLGRFRISVTSQSQPGLGLPEVFQAIARVPADQQTDAQKTKLATWFRKTDASYLAKQTALNQARQPLPQDPGVTKRKERIAFLEQPLNEDPLLVQLRSDFEFSKSQLDAKRLTATQDLAWALINSPAFLFNH